MNTFDAMIKDLALHVRKRLAVVEELSTIDFSIEIKGRTHDGDLNIEYQLGSTYREGGCVKGPKLEVMLDEYLRRFGWDKRNQPLCISFNGDEESPF